MEHNFFLPLVMSGNQQSKGVALAAPYITDVSNLKCSWYYNWSPQGNDGDGFTFVPMCWAGNETPSRTKGYVLFLNEPENRSQSNVTPKKAIDYLKNLKFSRPNMKVIAGGCGYFGRDWLIEFKDLVARNGIEISGYHIHFYEEDWVGFNEVTEYAQFVIDNFDGELWVTEFADVRGVDTMRLVEWILSQPRLTRYALFANRIDVKQPWYPSNWPKPTKMNLIDENGYLTSLGSEYREVGEGVI